MGETVVVDAQCSQWWQSLVTQALVLSTALGMALVRYIDRRNGHDRVNHG